MCVVVVVVVCVCVGCCCFGFSWALHSKRERTTKDLDAARECAGLALLVPLLDPRIGAHRLVDLLEVVAWGEVFAALLLATVEVHIGLVAVACHVLVGETWIEGGGLQLIGGHVAVVC